MPDESGQDGHVSHSWEPEGRQVTPPIVRLPELMHYG